MQTAAKEKSPGGKFDSYDIEKFAGFVRNYAEELYKSFPSKEERLLTSGHLPDYYPEQSKILAAKQVEEARRDGKLVKYLTEPYRFCVFPQSAINVMNTCNYKFLELKPDNSLKCKQTMCLNCCNNMDRVLKFLVQTRSGGAVFKVGNEQEWKKILQSVFQRTYIDTCRNVCFKEYYIEEEEVDFTPPNDTQLGRTEQNPAEDCRDVKENGGGTESDEYWIKGKKSPRATKMFCDQESEDGGWTLFTSYHWNRFQDKDITRQDGPPLSYLKAKSDFNPSKLGFAKNQLKELRFFCFQNIATKPVAFVHMVTKDAEMVEVAFKGKEMEFTEEHEIAGDGNKEWPDAFPKNDADKTIQAVNKEHKQVKVLKFKQKVKPGQVAKTADFLFKPFELGPQAIWEIGFTPDSFNCGPKGQSGEVVDAMFHIYFRGDALSKQEVLMRYKEKLRKERERD